MRREKFTFTVADAAIFLGKSPVTLRAWERKGDVEFPRVGTDRKLFLADLRKLALEAKGLNRISQKRLDVIQASITILEILENESTS